MYEYTIMNVNTKEQNIIFGYSYNNACKRANINGEEWEILHQEYVD